MFCYHCDLIEVIKRFELRILVVCMMLLCSAAAWLLLTRPVHRIEGDFLEREDKRQADKWLREKLVSSIGETRRRAALALGRIGDPQTLQLLIAATEDPSPRVRAMSAFAIGQMESFENLALEGRRPRSEAARALFVLLGDVERSVISYAVEALGKMHQGEVFGALLNTPAPLPVTLAALSRMKAKEAIPWVVELLRSDDQDVRRAAIGTLYCLDADLDEALTKKLIKRVRDRNWKVRVAALKTLARASSIQEVVKAVLVATKDSNPQVRIEAYRALGLLCPSDVVSDLAAGLRDVNINVRIAAVRALGKTGNRSTLQLVQSLRFRPDPVSYAAEEAMARLADSDEDYFSGITDLPVEYSSAAGRESFLRALDVLGSPRARNLLTELQLAESEHSKPYGEGKVPWQPRFAPVDYQRIARELNRRLTAHTTIGALELIVHYDKARLTAEHFIDLVEHDAFGSQRFVDVNSTRFVEFRATRPVFSERFPERVRCEINTEFFIRGSLGMFADPRDTGGYRFFIALTNLPEFDGRYTNFGRLVSGDSLINQITRETEILKITRF